jgi:Rrf2 family transcriptional regulator, nitric oxide-sensitive transcriptional repressor
MQLMRLTAFSDYSLRTLLYAAAAPEGRATVGEAALAFGVSRNHLVKVVHFLGKEGFLDNSRGRRGGFRLARPAADINLGDVIRRTEAGDMPAECFDPATNGCVLAGRCRLQRVLAEAVRDFYGTLGRYTLHDLRVRPQVLGLPRAP